VGKLTLCMGNGSLKGNMGLCNTSSHSSHSSNTPALMSPLLSYNPSPRIFPSPHRTAVFHNPSPSSHNPFLMRPQSTQSQSSQPQSSHSPVLTQHSPSPHKRSPHKRCPHTEVIAHPSSYGPSPHSPVLTQLPSSHTIQSSQSQSSPHTAPIHS
jgi:hypothetical protein